MAAAFTNVWTKRENCLLWEFGTLQIKSSCIFARFITIDGTLVEIKISQKNRLQLVNQPQKGKENVYTLYIIGPFERRN